MMPEAMHPSSSIPILSILIVGYNARQFLEGCLNSIRDHVTLSYEVILLDNGSSDGTSDYVAENYSWVRLIRSEKNLGFIGGNNFAAHSARGTYFLLLNQDTILLSDVLPAIQVLESDPAIGIVGAQMYGRNQDLRPSAGHFPKPMLLWKFGWLWSNANDHPFGDPAYQAFRVDWVEGSFLLTTTENWRALGGLDESNVFYGDDVDFCRSTANRGLITVHCTLVKYVHFGGYEVSRLGYIYAGFRRYHRKFSGYPEQLLADLVLRVGLIGRIGLFGLRYLITRDETVGKRFRQCVQVNKDWARTDSIAPRFG
jgi:GT2 family glycosyltransferase